MVECIHRGDIVAVDAEGIIIAAYGDPKKKTYWRSAAKPFQVIPLVEAGGLEHFGFTGEELAFMTSSHNGEERHVDTALSILNKLGQTPETLECGTAAPMYQKAASSLLKKGGSFNPLTNPCSGKHTSMLALALIRNYPLASYSDPAHPVQHEMFRTVSQITGVAIKDFTIGIDGCGVPVFGLPLLQMAKAYALLAKPDNLPDIRANTLRIIASAMTSHPYFVAGTNRLDTALMETTKGRILAKLGAEGVYCVSVMDQGIGIALKIEDGNKRAIDPVITELLSRLGFLSENELLSLQNYHTPLVKNHRGEIIGTIKPAF